MQPDVTFPVTIPANQDILIKVAGNDTTLVDEERWSSHEKTLLPSLITSIGNNARVKIEITQCSNVTINKRLSLGSSINQNGSKSQAALIDSVITGTIGRNVTLKILIVDSANIILNAQDSSLIINDADLIKEIINIDDGDNPLDNFKLDVELINCANIHCPEDNKECGVISINDGQLIDEILDCGEIKNKSNINIKIKDSANAHVNSINIVEGELVDELIDCLSIADSSVEIKISSSISTSANTISITEGELLDETMDVKNHIRNSKSDATITNSANAFYSATMTITGGELIDEIIDTNEITNSKIEIKLTTSGCASYIGNNAGHTFTLTNGELIDEIIDCSNNISDNNPISITVENSANLITQNSSNHVLVLNITNSQLLDELVDCPNINNNSITVEISSSGNIALANSILNSSDMNLIERIIDTENTTK
ncbi:hypothetical protein JYY36_000108 [Salmonella enterica subsp. diarizonae serovar 50:z:-]|nr:hypothetical protein [Salmonella enterica subsp. diarizonae serovar 50:z:-]